MTYCVGIAQDFAGVLMCYQENMGAWISFI